MNFLPSKIKNKFVLLTMSLKLTIKVVAFFLGHPVFHSHCSSWNICSVQHQTPSRKSLSRKSHDGRHYFAKLSGLCGYLVTVAGFVAISAVIDKRFVDKIGDKIAILRKYYMSTKILFY